MATACFLAIETGGTKIIARIADRDGAAIGERRFATTTPDEACATILAFVDGALPEGATLAGAAIAAFGPLILDPTSPKRGCLLATPKPGWSGSNLRAMLADALAIDVAVDSDVNAAALAEQAIGAGQGCRSIAYVTVGTGIGGGLAVAGETMRGFAHPEIGHLPIRRVAEDKIASTCPFHSDCAEGLAAGPAIGQRLGAGRKLVDDRALTAVIADYLGQLGAAITLTWSPDRIVWGGGVMQTPGLIEAIVPALRRTLNGYDAGWCSSAPDYCAAAILSDAGLDGAMLMARRGR